MFRDARALACTLVVAEFAWRALLVTHLQSRSAHQCSSRRQPIGTCAKQLHETGGFQHKNGSIVGCLHALAILPVIQPLAIVRVAVGQRVAANEL